MSISADQLAALKADAAGAQSQGGGGKFFRPRIVGGAPTKFVIRILPGPEDDPFNFTGKSRVHYFNDFDISGTCPKHFDEPCSVCDDLAADPWSVEGFFDKDEYPKTNGKGPLFEPIKKLEATAKILFNILDLSTDKGPLVFSLPQQTAASFGSVLLGEITTYFEEGQNVLDPAKGRNYNLKLKPLGKSHTYEGDFSDRRTKIVKKYDGWLENLHVLDRVAEGKVITQAELKTVRDAFRKEHGI